VPDLTVRIDGRKADRAVKEGPGRLVTKPVAPSAQVHVIALEALLNIKRNEPVGLSEMLASY